MQRGHFKGERGTFSIKRERKRKSPKEKEIEKDDLAVWSDVAGRATGQESRPDLVPVLGEPEQVSCLSGPQFPHLEQFGMF